jgi:hypothetical protein
MFIKESCQQFFYLFMPSYFYEKFYRNVQPLDKSALSANASIGNAPFRVKRILE